MAAAKRNVTALLLNLLSDPFMPIALRRAVEPQRKRIAELLASKLVRFSLHFFIAHHVHDSTLHVDALSMKIMRMMGSDKILLTKRDAASALSVSIRTIDNLILAAELIPRRIGKRVLFERRVLEQFARRDHATGMGRSDAEQTDGVEANT